MQWAWIGAVALGCCLFRWVYYHRRMQFLLDYRESMVKWLTTGDKAANDRLNQDVTDAQRLLKEAHVDIVITVVEPVGFGQLRSAQLRPLTRPASRDGDVAQLNLEALSRAIGHFRRRRNESFDPFFWLEAFLHLPAHVFPLVEKGPELVKEVVQLLWYLAVFYGAVRTGTVEAVIAAIRELAGGK